MSDLEIRRALETRLAALLPAVDIAAENVAYTPTIGRPYQEVWLLPNTPLSPTLGNRELTQERGILQVSLYYPLNKGTREVMERAEAVRGHFPRGLTLSSGGVSVVIERRASVAPGRPVNGWYVVPVSVPYFSWIIQA